MIPLSAHFSKQKEVLKLIKTVSDSVFDGKLERLTRNP
jgi:hypothetical protein